MSFDKETIAEILNDHYKDTCERIRENVSLRDRLFLWVLAIVGIHFLQITDRTQSSDAIISFFKEQSGFQLAANADILSAILWFLLLALAVRYFQANVYVNRQYTYLHELEKKFDPLIGNALITREGRSYLDKYPAFNKWMHCLYTWAFPVLLLAVITFKIWTDWPGFDKLGASFVLSGACFLMLLISTFLYLIFLHKNK